MNLRANCIGLWRMNEASWSGEANEVIDNSGQNNHGVRVGNADTVAEGKIKRCGSFGGNGDYVSISEIDVDGNASISLWVYAEDVHAAYNMFMGKIDADNYIALRADANSIYLQDNGSVNKVWPFILSTGQWYHFVVRRDSTNWEVFIDGESLGTQPVSVSNGNLLIDAIGAGYTIGNVFEWIGKIDAVMIFNKKLSDAEIAFLWNEGNGREHLGIARPLVGGSLASGRKGLV